jgi:hypothetical protein
MGKLRFTESQIVGILREGEAGLSNSPTNPLKFLHKRSHFPKHGLLFGQVQRVQGAHFGEQGVEFGAVVAGVFALERVDDIALGGVGVQVF